jgi:superfamily II DNA or RNA helicase
MSLMPKSLRKWQELALASWRNAGRRGIVAVVTGGGKTFFALNCLKEYRSSVPAATALIVVPTDALLDQWLEEITSFFGLSLDEIIVLNTRKKIQLSRIHIGVINTVAKIAENPPHFPVFIIVDECHKAASPIFREIFKISSNASLGLSATPERPYDSGLEDVLVPNLGNVLFKYTYKEAKEDGVIVPFSLKNIVFEFDADEQQRYNNLTRSIQISIEKHGIDTKETIRLLLKRARFSNLSLSRVKITLRLVAKHRLSRILIFHEDIGACDLIYRALNENKIKVGLYHSKMTLKDRVITLANYRKGLINVLVSCRALDEGFNVPETEIGIIAASTATHRQRVQRLGRVLRPSPGKDKAIIYSIVASPPEIRRLAQEAESLDGIADIDWIKA